MEEKAGRHAVEADNDPMLKTAVRFIASSLAWTIPRVVAFDASVCRLLVSLCASGLPLRQRLVGTSSARHRPAIKGTGFKCCSVGLIGLTQLAHDLAAGRGRCLGCQEAGCRGEAGL